MTELIVTRLDPVSGEWEHNHAEGRTGTKEDGEKWIADLLDGKAPEGKFCKWDKIIGDIDNGIEVQNFRYGSYAGPEAGKLLHSIQRARLTIIFDSM